MPEVSAETQRNSSQHDASDNYVTQVPFSLTPAHVLAAASLPLCIGTYIGFKRQLKIVEKEARAAADGLDKEVSVALTRESKSVARRALGLGTLLSVGSFGLFGAGEYWSNKIRMFVYRLSCVAHLSLSFSVAFYASGFQSCDEAVSYLHEWGPRRRSQFENLLGIDAKRNDGDPDVQATRNMTADEELEYYRTRYFSEEATKGADTQEKQ